MQYSIVALFTMVAAVMAAENLAPRQQNAVIGGVPVGQPAMTDAQGNVVPFDAKNVFMAGQAAGL